jgi:hypothetical protein
VLRAQIADAAIRRCQRAPVIQRGKLCNCIDLAVQPQTAAGD